MASTVLNGASRQVALLPKTCCSKSLSVRNSSSLSSSWTFYSDGSKRREEKRRFFLSISPDNLLSVPARSFHHRPLIQLHIQHTGPHGILLEALQNVQKSRVSASKNPSRDGQPLHYLNIPDELKRLKQGSLKWLFQVWPGNGSKNYSALTTIKGALQKEVDNEGDVKKMVSKTEKMLRSATEQQLYDVLDYLKMKNIAIRRLIKLPWLLTIDPQVIEMKVNQVQELLKISRFEVAISFVNLVESKLVEAAILWEKEVLEGEDGQVFENRIEWLASKLMCVNEDVSDMMARYPKVMMIPSETIEEILICLMEECGVKPEAIISDPWVFSNNLKTLHVRARILQDNEILEVKPWVFRSPQRLFDKFVQKRLNQRELLGDNKDIRGFLHEKLECPKGSNKVEEILQRVPSIKTATVMKLNEMIEFLFSAGFSPEQIRETPRILAHSVETISERLEEVSSCNRPVNNLQLLCRTSKEYRAVLRKLRRHARS